MKYSVLILFLFGVFSFANEKTIHQKLLEKHVGKWNMVMSATLVIKGQDPQNMHFKSMLKSELILKNNFIFQQYISKGKDLNGAKKETEAVEFLFWDKAKKNLVLVQFSSDKTSFTQTFKIENENKFSAILKEVDKVHMSHSIEFLKGGKERTGFFVTQNDLIDMTMNMNWNGQKVEKFEKKFQFDEINNKDKELEKFKTKTNKWFLKGAYLYEEVKGEKQYIEIIGKMITLKDTRKYQFHADGQVLAFESVEKDGKTIWEKIDYEYKIPGM